MKPLGEAWSDLPKKSKTARAQCLMALHELASTSAATASSSSQIERHLAAKLGRPNVREALPSAMAHQWFERTTHTPQRFFLTRSGVVEAQALMGAQSATAASPPIELATEDSVDIALICALPEELEAGKSALSKDWSDDARYPGLHFVQRTSLKVGDRKLSVLAAAPNTMGLTATAILASQICIYCRPKMVVMSGIAGGVGHSRTIGDVLVATTAVDYMSGKVIDADGRTELLPSPYPVHVSTEFASLIRGKEKGLNARLLQIWNNWPGDRPAVPPQARIGEIGSADQVVDAESQVRLAQAHWRKIIGVEMEIYAVYRAAFEAQTKPLYISLKSVSDFASKKGDDFRKYAQYVSANSILWFLELFEANESRLLRRSDKL